METRIGVEYKNLPFVVCVTLFDYLPACSATFDAPAEYAFAEPTDGYVELDVDAAELGHVTAEEVEVLRMFANDNAALFNILCAENAEEITEALLEEVEQFNEEETINTAIARAYDTLYC